MMLTRLVETLLLKKYLVEYFNSFLFDKRAFTFFDNILFSFNNAKMFYGNFRADPVLYKGAASPHILATFLIVDFVKEILCLLFS